MRYLNRRLDEGADPAMDMAFTHAVLRQASRGEVYATLRVYRPAATVVAFGRRDTNRPGFVDAVVATRAAGFTPVVRAVGGRAVAYTADALVIDHVSPDPASLSGMEARFREFGDLLAGALRGLGVDARVGEVPGEYCPGAHSVNAHGHVKLVGTAQRLVRNAWLFSSVVVFDGVSVLRPLLSSVYDALELPFDPASVGAVHDEQPAATLDAVEDAIVAAYSRRSGRSGMVPVEVDDATITQARAMIADHHVG